MTIAALDVAYRASVLLNDSSDSSRWPATELVAWMNDAVKAAVVINPSVASSVLDITLATGTKQVLGGIAELAGLTPYALLDITRNTAVASAGGAVRQITRTSLESQSPTWATTTASVNIQHFMFDVRAPDTFFVYPPAAAGAKVEAVVSVVPAAVPAPSGTLWSTVSGNIALSAVYLPAIVDYVCYRAFMKDATVEATSSRAAGFYQMFLAAVGGEPSATSGDAPKISSNTGQE